jgi:hypothetical protein
MRILPLIPALLVVGFVSAAHASDADDKSTKEERKEMKEESKEHPRIVAAIKELEGAIEELKKAPHDFGGHRDDAIKACEEARKQLHEALKYRADKEDNKGEKK